MAYKNLKKLREQIGMTQEEFGKSLGLAKSTYNNYETGEREPKSDFWITAAQKYGVTIDYLMGFSDDPHLTADHIQNTPAPSEDSTGVTVSKADVERFLVDSGFIQPGEDLSDRDLHFLFSIGEVIRAWFTERGK